MLVLTLTTLLSAAPATGLVLSTQMGRENVPAEALLNAIEHELINPQLAVRRLALACKGQSECLLAGAKKERLDAYVAVSLAYGKKQTTIDLEAVRTRDGASVGQLTFTLSGALTTADRTAVGLFGQQLATALVVEVKPDAPVVQVTPVLTPEPKPEPLAVVTQPAPVSTGRSRVPAWVMGGGAAASAVTSGVFLAMATSARASVEAPGDTSTLTRAQATQLAATANTDYSVALATGVAAGALLTGALVWLLTE